MSDKLAKTIRYSFIDGGGLMLYSVFSTYIIFFYTDVVQADPRIIGIAWFAFAFWNGVNDFGSGWISEILIKRLGSRKKIIQLLMIPFAITFIAIWLPDSTSFQNTTITFIYFIITISIFDMFYSFISLNQYALFPTLFKTTDERIKAASIRSVVSNSIGGFFLIITPIIYSSRFGWRGLALILGIISALFIIASLPSLEVKPDKNNLQKNQNLKLIPTIKKIFSSSQFLIYLMISLFLRFFFAVILTITPFYVKYVLQISESNTTFITGLTLISGLASLIFWNKIIKNLGFIKSTIISITITSIAILLFIISNTFITTLITSSILGFTFGGTLFITMHLFFTDITDTNKNMEGIYAGVVGITNRLPPALIGLIFGFILSITEFDPNLSPELQPSNLSTYIRSFLIIGSIIALILSSIFVVLYQRHKQNLERIN